MFTKDWWHATAIRVARTAAQTFIAAVGADYVGWFTSWHQIALSVLTMSLLAFATSVAFPPPEGK